MRCVCPTSTNFGRADVRSRPSAGRPYSSWMASLGDSEDRQRNESPTPPDSLSVLIAVAPVGIQGRGCYPSASTATLDSLAV
jgi:hypothetical protein